MIDMIKKDYEEYGLSVFRLIRGWFVGHAFYAVLLYRISHALCARGIPFIPDVIKFKMVRRFACEILPGATIGAPFRLHHTVGIVIGHEVIMGNNCEVFQNVTIGSNRKERNGRYMPIIGNNVSIGSGAVVVGAISIGDNVIIGANSYVDKDVPSNVVVAGVPAKIIRHNSQLT